MRTTIDFQRPVAVKKKEKTEFEKTIRRDNVCFILSEVNKF